MIDLHNALIAGRMIGGNGGSPAPEPTLITKSITTNGTYSAEDDNADGYSAVSVEVPEKVLTTKTITENGTYNAASDNVDGYSSVTVNTPAPNNIDVMTSDNMVFGKELKSDGSLRSSSSSTYVTDYLPVSGFAKVHIIRPVYTAVCFYDSNKDFVSYTSSVVSGYVDVPQNAAYARFNSQEASGVPATAKSKAAFIVFNE